MIINNWHLLENRKWGLRDPRLPLTPAVLPAGPPCDGRSQGSTAAGVTPWGHQPCQSRAGGRWAGHVTRGQRRPRQRLEAGVETCGPPAETGTGGTPSQGRVR